MIDALISACQFVIDGFASIAQFMINLLPVSPFKAVQNSSLEFVQELNWVIPFQVFFTITTYWVTAIGLYYVVMVVLRWVKVIE